MEFSKILNINSILRAETITETEEVQSDFVCIAAETLNSMVKIY